MSEKQSWPMRNGFNFQVTWWAIITGVFLILFLIVPPLIWLFKPVALWCVDVGAAWINYWK